MSKKAPQSAKSSNGRTVNSCSIVEGEKPTTTIAVAGVAAAINIEWGRLLTPLQLLAFHTLSTMASFNNIVILIAINNEKDNTVQL